MHAEGVAMATEANFERRTVDANVLAQARDHAHKRIEADEHRRAPGLDEEQRKSKIVVGTVAGLVLRNVLEREGIVVDTDFEHVEAGFTSNVAFRTRYGDYPEKRLDLRTQANDNFPNDTWRCEVTQDQYSRDIDAVVFAKLRSEAAPGTVWFVGWMLAERFRNLAKFYARGDRWPTGHVVRYPAYSVDIKDLESFDSLISWLKR